VCLHHLLLTFKLDKNPRSLAILSKTHSCVISIYITFPIAGRLKRNAIWYLEFFLDLQGHLSGTDTVAAKYRSVTLPRHQDLAFSLNLGRRRENCNLMDTFTQFSVHRPFPVIQYLAISRFKTVRCKSEPRQRLLITELCISEAVEVTKETLSN